MQRLIRSLFFVVCLAGLRASGQGSLPDHFASASLVTQEEFGITTIISTNLASAEPGEPDHAGQPARHSQWFRVQYANSGYLTLFVNNLLGFRMAVYTGDTLETLQEVTSAAIRSGDQVMGFRVDAGVTYSVAIELADPPPRGTIQSFRGSFGRLFIAPESSVLPTRSPATAGFALESGDPSEYPLDVTFLVNGQVRTNLTAPPWRFELTADRGGPTMISARVRTNLRSVVNVRNIQWTLVAGNDSWSEAAVIPGSASDWSAAENLFFTSAESEEPPINPGQPAVRSVWWKWVPQFSGKAQFTASGATFQLFAGGVLASLTPLPISAGEPFSATAGTTYYVRLAQAFEEHSGGTTLALQRPVLQLIPPAEFQVSQPGNQYPTVYLTADVPQRLFVTEFNPVDQYPAIYLQAGGPEFETVASAVDSPRWFEVTPVLGQMTTWRVVATNQQGEVRTSAPLTIIGAVAHDRFAEAQTVPSSGLAGWDWSGLSWAGREAGEPDPGVPGGSLWYRWTAPVSGTARVKVSTIPGPLIVSAYSGSSLMNLTRIAAWLGTATNPFELAVPVVAGTTYFWQVVGEAPGVLAQLTVETTGVAPVASELRQGVPVELRSFRAAGAENETVTWWLGSNVLTNQTPNPQAVSTWIPSVSGVFNLRAIATGAAGERVLFDVTGWIRPANDRAADASPVVIIPGIPSQSAAVGSLAGATLEPGEIPGFELGQGTVWFDWTVPAGGAARIRQIRGADPVQVELWELGVNGVLIARGKWAHLNQPISVDVPAGTACRLAVSSPHSNAGEFELRLGLAPSNDQRLDATELVVPPTGGSVPLFSSTVFASSEPGETNLPALGAFQRYGTLWWKFTAPEHGGALFHLLESEHQNQAAVFTGTAWSDLKLLVGQEVTQGNPVAWLPFRTRARVTYWIAAGANGNFDFALGPVAGSFDYLAVPELVNNDFADRIQLSGRSHTIRSSNQQASREPGEPAGLNQTLWWEWTAPGKGFVRISVIPDDQGSWNQVSVFSGETLAALGLLSPQPRMPVESGQRFALAVGNREGASGPFVLEIRWEPEFPEVVEIVRQPDGASAALGQYLALEVGAVGPPPLEYQWFHKGQALFDATNRALVIRSVQPQDLGTYQVRVQSRDSSVLSWPVPVVGAPSRLGGGRIEFAAQKDEPVPFRVNVSDSDGVTLLSGEAFVAQLYAGPSAETLRPVGRPSPFLTGAQAGLWETQLITLPQIAPGEAFVAQVRVWEAGAGASYEAARASGGRFGRSPLVNAVASSPEASPTAIATFASFALQKGDPEFDVGRIQPVSVQSDGSVSWRLTGAMGFRYLLERLTHGTTWEPVQVFEDFSGNETFSTPAFPEMVFLRARLLD